jgi:hypothetical protein
MPSGHFIFVLLLIIQQFYISREKITGQFFMEPFSIDGQRRLQSVD